MTAALLLSPEADRRVHVGQGEHHVSDEPGLVLTTVLGSCVAACIFDPVRRVGGMNHFLLPDGAGTGVGQRYGAYAMELLINEVLKAGARRDRLEAKLFGGGRMFDTLGDVGGANADFAERYLVTEGIQLVGGSLRGTGGRSLHYWPASGRAFQRTVADRAALQPVRPAPRPAGGEVELFG
jgi:chemotaxis protein CheD